jgi:pyruvate formate lyase activating enzyme
LATCAVCGVTSPLVSRAIGVCRKCLKEREERALEVALSNHRRYRAEFGLPPDPPRTPGGIPCNLCAARCVMGEGELGYCGIRGVKGGKLWSLSTPEKGLLHYYLDPHVTNCCNAWWCPAATGCGYPKYAVAQGPETGYYNLALFFYGCSFNCLFCQNWTHKVLSCGKLVTARELVDLTLANKRITCWCWFGGSAEPQMPFAINASRLLVESKGDRVCRVCWEWNGDGNPALVRRAAELSSITGGNIKFDLKAFDERVHMALTGMSNEQTLRNFELVCREFFDARPEPPVLGATTLLVPHYVDAEEVERIAEFIASLDDRIPYSLLVFHPDFKMDDVPVTPERQVWECYRAARRHLKRVHIGNLHLLYWPAGVRPLA